MTEYLTIERRRLVKAVFWAWLAGVLNGAGAVGLACYFFLHG